MIPAGDTTIVAELKTLNGCDSIYTLHLTVLVPPTTYGKDTIILCSGETAVYGGKEYKRATVDSVLFAGQNYLGGDSIVELVVNVLPSLRLKSEMSITEGYSIEWQGIDLSELTVGDTTLTVVYTSTNGCDSVYVLELHVSSGSTVDIQSVGTDDRAVKFFRNGVMYIRKNNQVYNLQGIKVETIE